MTHLTTLTDKLIAVLVPDQYPAFWVHWNGIEQTTQLANDGVWIWIDFKQKLDGNPEDYKIVGTIDKKGNYTFDCGEYAEEHPHSETYWMFAMMPLYLIHGMKQLIGKETRFKNGTESAEMSFASLLQAKGIFPDKLENKKILILEKCST
jgi:hypothetical protein